MRLSKMSNYTFGPDHRDLKKGDIIYLKNIIGSDYILYQSGIVIETGFHNEHGFQVIDRKFTKIKLTDPEQELGREVIIYKTRYSGSVPFYDGHDNDYDVEVIAEGVDDK